MDALMWSLLLLVITLALIVLEVFIPSGGVLSVLAALSLIGCVIMAFSAGWVPGVLMMVALMVTLPLLIAALIRWWPITPIGRMMVLDRPQSEEDVLPDTPEYRALPELLGRRGVAKTRMLPSGGVVIDGRVYDALADGVAIEPGTPVRVAAVRANRIIVTIDRAPPLQLEEGDLLSQPAGALGVDSLDGPLRASE